MHVAAPLHRGNSGVSSEESPSAPCSDVSGRAAALARALGVAAGSGRRLCPALVMALRALRVRALLRARGRSAVAVGRPGLDVRLGGVPVRDVDVRGVSVGGARRAARRRVGGRVDALALVALQGGGGRVPRQQKPLAERARGGEPLPPDPDVDARLVEEVDARQQPQLLVGLEVAEADGARRRLARLAALKYRYLSVLREPAAVRVKARALLASKLPRCHAQCS
eukprot:6178550-Pleurochrysis_carterae.AAC.2